MNGEPILVPFGPRKEVPAEHRWCFACDGSGENPNADDGQCEVCKGKGHWNADDIREYHKRHPDICGQSCGAHHVEPYFGPPRDPHELTDALARADAILKKLHQ